MASGPITSWEIDGETVETVACRELETETLPMTRSGFKELARKGVQTSGVSRDRPTIHSQAFIVSSSDAWRSSMFPKN